MHFCGFHPLSGRNSRLLTNNDSFYATISVSVEVLVEVLLIVVVLLLHMSTRTFALVFDLVWLWLHNICVNGYANILLVHPVCMNMPTIDSKWIKRYLGLSIFPYKFVRTSIHAPKMSLTLLHTHLPPITPCSLSTSSVDSYLLMNSWTYSYMYIFTIYMTFFYCR